MKTKTPQNQSQEGNSTRKVLNRENGEDRKTSDGASPSPDTQTPEEKKGCGKKFSVRDLLTKKNRDGSPKYSDFRNAICGEIKIGNAFIDYCNDCLKDKTSGDFLR